MFVIMMIISIMDNMMLVLTIRIMMIRMTMVVILVFMALMGRMTTSYIMISMALMAVWYIVSLEALSTLMCHTRANIWDMMY